MTKFKPRRFVGFRLVLSQLLDVLAIFYNVLDNQSEKRTLNRIYIGMFVTFLALIIFLVARSALA